MSAEEQHVEQSTLALLHARTPALLIANLVNALLTAVVLREAASPAWIVAWLAVFVLVLAIRLMWWFGCRNQQTPGWTARWRRRAEWGSYSSGLLWGLAGFAFLVPDSPIDLALIVFVLGGMAAGALTTLSADPRALNGFLILSLAPLCVRLALLGGVANLAMSGMAGLFTVLLILLGRQTNRVLVRSFALRHENRELVRSLGQRVEDRTHRHAAVVEFSHRALSGLDTDSLLREAATIVADGPPETTAVIWEWLSDSGTLRARSAAGPYADRLVGAEWPADTGSPAGYALMVGEPTISDELRSEQRFAVPDLLHETHTACLVSVPIWGPDAPFGVIEAWTREPPCAVADDVNFLRAVATTIAAALERRRSDEKLEKLALHDVLTGLPNRFLFRDTLNRAVSQAHRHGEYVALLLIDIDHFKDVNDTLGHAAGDRLLAKLAERMRDCTRRAEPPARLGGDEFGIVLSGLPGPDAAATVADKLVNVLGEGVSLSGQDIHVGASIGITVYPGDGADPDHLLRNADLALYRAKAQGRGGYSFYSKDMARDVQNRADMLRDLRGAIDGQELHLEYQPQVDLGSGRITGFESLLRWTSPKMGSIGPDNFIPVAETSGLITSLGDWTMRRACAQVHEWSKVGVPKVKLGVNVSLAQWRRLPSAEIVDRVLKACAFETHGLELEITERALPVGEDKGFLDCLSSLRQEGVSISIDDFGTGHSNLTRLRHLPVDRIKVDSSFIAGVGRDTTAEIIVRAIIALSRNLGLQVVAEGVEHQAQLDFLRAEGCDVAQGYLLGSPMRPELVPAWMNRNNADETDQTASFV